MNATFHSPGVWPGHSLLAEADGIGQYSVAHPQEDEHKRQGAGHARRQGAALLPRRAPWPRGCRSGTPIGARLSSQCLP